MNENKANKEISINQTGINRNTYYIIPNWLIALKTTLNRGNGKYNLTKTDIKKGYFVTLNLYGIECKIPFKAIFHTNSKIKGIKGLDFNNATFCDSFRLGLCQIPNKNLCYAFVFENMYKYSLCKDGTFKLNAYFNGIWISKVLKMIWNDSELFKRFLEYIDNNIKYLRFNVNSDFKDINDYKMLMEIVNYCKNTIIYGYTARDDLLIGFKDNKPNLFINGSNKYYTNKYSCTFSLETYFKANNKCLGSCLDCKKCFKLRDSEIIVLFHNSKSDSILNTFENRKFLIKVFGAFNMEISETDLKIKKGLFASLNQTLINKFGLDLELYDISNLKDLILSLDSLHFDIMDNIDLYNVDELKRIGII